jgi:hypothetical protein
LQHARIEASTAGLEDEYLNTKCFRTHGNHGWYSAPAGRNITMNGVTEPWDVKIGAGFAARLRAELDAAPVTRILNYNTAK